MVYIDRNDSINVLALLFYCGKKEIISLALLSFYVAFNVTLGSVITINAEKVLRGVENDNLSLNIVAEIKEALMLNLSLWVKLCNGVNEKDNNKLTEIAIKFATYRSPILVHSKNQLNLKCWSYWIYFSISIRFEENIKKNSG